MQRMFEIQDSTPRNRVRVSWVRWEPNEQRFVYRCNFKALVSRWTPSNADLTRWAGRVENKPPSAWFEEDANPFRSDESDG